MGRSGQPFPVPLTIKAKPIESWNDVHLISFQELWARAWRHWAYENRVRPAFTAAPRRKATQSHGLAIGHIECEATSTSQTIDIHGIRVGLLRRDRSDHSQEVQILSGVFKDGSEWMVEYDPRPKEPLRTFSGNGRSLDQTEKLAHFISQIEQKLADSTPAPALSSDNVVPDLPVLTSGYPGRVGKWLNTPSAKSASPCALAEQWLRRMAA
jgi:hypothetical protein